MRPRGFALGLAITMMSAVLWALGGPVAAGEATDQIRSHIDQMYRLVAQTGPRRRPADGLDDRRGARTGRPLPG